MQATKPCLPSMISAKRYPFGTKWRSAMVVLLPLTLARSVLAKDSNHQVGRVLQQPGIYIRDDIRDEKCSKDNKCGVCIGDCDEDEDCQGNLICFRRKKKDPVPHCAGGEDNDTSKDFCTYPDDAAPVQAFVPTMTPSAQSAELGVKTENDEGGPTVSTLPVQKLEESVVEMTIGGVTPPLSEASEEIVEQVTSNSIASSIRSVLDPSNVENVTVVVFLTPKPSRSLRAAMPADKAETKARRRLEAVTFRLEVAITIQSVIQNHDVDRYVLGALNDNEEKYEFLAELKNSEDAAFANVDSVFVTQATDTLDDGRVETSGNVGSDEESNRLVTIVIPVVMALVVGFGVIAFFIYRRRKKSRKLDTVTPLSSPVAPSSPTDTAAPESGGQPVISEIDTNYWNDTISSDDLFQINARYVAVGGGASLSSETYDDVATIDQDIEKALRHAPSSSMSRKYAGDSTLGDSIGISGAYDDWSLDDGMEKASAKGLASSTKKRYVSGSTVGSDSVSMLGTNDDWSLDDGVEKAPIKASWSSKAKKYDGGSTVSDSIGVLGTYDDWSLDISQLPTGKKDQDTKRCFIPSSLVIKDDDTMGDVSYILDHVDSNREIFEVQIPPGIVGLELQDSPEGPIVHRVKSTSPMLGKVKKGDKLISLDGTDVSTMAAKNVSRLVTVKKTLTKRFVFARHRPRGARAVAEETDEESEHDA